MLTAECHYQEMSLDELVTLDEELTDQINDAEWMESSEAIEAGLASAIGKELQSTENACNRCVCRLTNISPELLNKAAQAALSVLLESSNI